MQSPNVLCGAKSTSVRLSAAEQTCPYDAQASIFKCCTSAVYPVSKEHVMALNMSVRLCAGQGDADSGAGLPPTPHPALHVTSDHVNAAVTHFQQPLPTWQSSSPSFCFFIFCDTRLDTQSFSIFCYWKTRAGGHLYVTGAEWG